MISPHRAGGRRRCRTIFAKVTVEAPGEEKGATFGMMCLDTVAAIGKTVDKPGLRSGPCALTVEAIDRYEFLFSVAGVVKVDPQRRILEAVFERFSRRGSGGNGEYKDEYYDGYTEHTGPPAV